MNEPVNDGSSLLGRTAGTAMAIGGSIAAAALGVGAGKMMWASAANKSRKGALAFKQAMGKTRKNVAKEIDPKRANYKAYMQSQRQGYNKYDAPIGPEPLRRTNYKGYMNSQRSSDIDYGVPIGPKTQRQTDYKSYMNSQKQRARYNKPIGPNMIGGAGAPAMNHSGV